MRHDETVLPVGGFLVRAYRAGAGAELVLLHGGGPDDARRAWEPVWTVLAGRARVTAPDLPGFGGTPLGATVPTLAGYAAWLGAFLDACGIERAGIAGRSLGGRIALRAALDLPDRVSRVAVCGARTRLIGRRLDGVACPVLVLGDAPGRDAEELAAFLSPRAIRDR
ncbi:pimeloyl-ACP methyl ester carboxylesterase [Nonomuraea thailandensis]|uniref:Pimeloyl-ACP methyl ester carboxylesterase n=1 Tax=Nonomuraea thailandensis TaxID=1188745 RepID=A0A9X2K4M1_9ACTN|nr:alpha/beta fold hydrolase [Nonomuraea thailandensis]MCP2360203.1 pimeloyl-ACP methyl ester carboxylesterase [Nonomuraea thailandensis]